VIERPHDCQADQPRESRTQSGLLPGGLDRVWLLLSRFIVGPELVDCPTHGRGRCCRRLLFCATSTDHRTERDGNADCGPGVITNELNDVESLFRASLQHLDVARHPVARRRHVSADIGCIGHDPSDMHDMFPALLKGGNRLNDGNRVNGGAN
jgi:hypothetical protein